MEDKINEQDHLLKEQKIIMRRADENEEEIQRYVHTNKKLTEKYKTTLADIRREFEGVIYSLKKEITVLKAEKHLSSKDYQQKFT
ncbi:unnamed protein product [Ceratitis capitata]|nr:unnamed protein product [Ceratitis capitata]